MLDRSKYKNRIIDETLKKYLTIFGAVCIEGPKWCGKTWTSLYHSNSHIMLGDPSKNFQNRELVKLDYDIALDGTYPRLIDEWQEIPALWDAIRYKVDFKEQKGQFILTGSSTPNHKGILHSGIGRIATLKMLPMSLYEAGFSDGSVSLRDLCNNKFSNKPSNNTSLIELAQFIVRGGWPDNVDVNLNDIKIIPRNYISSILKNDIFVIENKSYNVHKMELLLKSLARNESTTVSNNKILNDIKENANESVDIDTVNNYLDLFNRLFILDDIYPYSENIRSKIRIKQSRKRHFVDPSLACGFLNITPNMLIDDLKTFGFMFESLCLRDLRIYAIANDYNLFHYQDYENNEIDAVLELGDGNWCAIEIKLGASQIDDAAKNLIRISKKIEEKGGKKPKILCVICGLTNFSYRRDDGVYVVGITSLKN